MDTITVLYKWLWAPIVGLLSGLIMFGLNSNKKDRDAMRVRVSKLEVNVASMESAIKPMAKKQEDMHDDINKIFDVVTDIRIKAAANAKAGTNTYLQE